MLIKSNKDKLDVKINIRNSKDNAYNTKVILSFSPNINYVKAKVSCLELLSATPLFPPSLFCVLTCVFFCFLWFVWYSHHILSGGLHSEPHQGGLRRRIPLPREQRGGQFQLITKHHAVVFFFIGAHHDPFAFMSAGGIPSDV